MGIRNTISFTGQALSESYRRFARYFRKWSILGSVSSRPAPDRLLFAPQDLRTVDPEAALEIYSGKFFLAGQMVELNGTDPFNQANTTQSWETELHKFLWLRHLGAAQTNLSQNNAQALINDWLASYEKPDNSIAWKEEIAGQRLIAWLSHSVPIIESASPQFYKAWLKSFSTHIRFLKQNSADAPDGMPRLICKIALAFASICVSDQSTYLRNASSNLDAELDRQILADGGHVSRNAAYMPILLALLLPLRQCYAKLELAPSQSLIASIDRMMGAIKFHRLGDGSFARFNGVSVTQTDLISTILRYDDSKSLPANEAFASGYQRLSNGRSVLMFDVGKQPKNELSLSAHASTLAFEMTDGSTPIIVNCGYPFVENHHLQHASRTTAAHSTATINDESSSIIYKEDKYNLGGRVVTGPSTVTASRDDGDTNATCVASHNGYFPRFGVIHHRFLGLSKDGNKLIGEDKFTGEQKKPIKGKLPLQFTIRFHLHPSLSAGKTENGRSILIMAGKGIAWKFTCIDVIPQLEESGFFASLSGTRKTRQIVLTGDARAIESVRWVFEKQFANNTKKTDKSAKAQTLPL